MGEWYNRKLDLPPPKYTEDLTKSRDCSISFSAVLLAVLGLVAGMLLRPELS